MANTHFPPNWQGRLLHVVGAPRVSESLRLLDAWARAEGGTAKWNPLNTTTNIEGATNYNSIGVKNYPRPTCGVCMQGITLTNGQYNGILGDLQAGVYTAEQIVDRNPDEFEHWGTGVDLLKSVLRSM